LSTVHSDTIKIDGRPIGRGNPPYIIAELSGNHNGNIERALALIDAAHASGADAVKLQTYTADTLTIDYDGPGFQISEGLWKGRSLYELYQEAHTPWDWHERLFSRARKLGITMFSSPFDVTAIDLLEELETPAYKIASFEAIDIPLIERTAATGKPLIISTGMATLEEIEEALAAARRTGTGEIALLHCVSGYPTPIEESNLHTINDLRNRFDVVIGLSDHTSGITVPIASIALGASIIEKHFTLSRDDGGPDAKFSLEPDELTSLCKECKNAWLALGNVNYARKNSEQTNAIFRRSLYVVEDIAKGELFNANNIRSIRPGHGVAPKYLPEFIGKTARTSLKKGTPLAIDHIKQE